MRFFVPGLPAPQGSKRHIGRGVLIESSARLKAWRDTVATVAAKHATRPSQGPVRVCVEFILPRPKAWGRLRADPHTCAPDLDKLVRAVGDSLGAHYRDDAQIVAWHATKRRALPGEDTGAWITIHTQEDL